ncbi:MAG: glycosyltransferase [Candidatus Scalindua sp.]|jgi:glycosyltransferase involved in cell wall biosynthesis|nr:glycosyltransferase [Candidatus Scalindua sp.]
MEAYKVKPVISVVMSVFNAENYLSETIESILAQTFRNFEFIIVNDGSTDTSLNIITSYNDQRIVIINQSNLGLSKALNNGIRIANTDYICRIDADDIALPQRLDKQYEFMQNNPNCVCVGSNAIYITEKGEELYTSRKLTDWTEIRMRLPLESPFFHSTVMFRKEICIRTGGYYEGIKHHIEDILLWNKLSEHGELRNIDDVLLKYRLVPNAITNNFSKRERKSLNQILQNILKYGEISSQDKDLLNIITKSKSKYWKLSNFYLKVGVALLQYRTDAKMHAIKYLAKAVFANPFNIKALFFLLLSLQPKLIIKKWNNLRRKN